MIAMRLPIAKGYPGEVPKVRGLEHALLALNRGRPSLPGMMQLPRIAALYLVALFCAGAWSAPLPEDPRILKGQLENGLRWMYRQHNNPPGKMAIQMHVRTGS